MLIQHNIQSVNINRSAICSLSFLIFFKWMFGFVVNGYFQAFPYMAVIVSLTPGGIQYFHIVTGTVAI